ncbi:MAG TPA: nucleotidyltransferase family protein, partial [Pseudomonadales bacterium]|nr:nucleotidyltransferase family protein [Pseudomonadales bacterium]
MAVLRAVRRLRLPDAAVGAGFVRSAVWDGAHGFEVPTPLDDVDVLYFDARNRSRSQEACIEKALSRRLPGVPFSVRNQARMHRRNGDAPYRGTADAMRFWLETATCVAVRLRRDGGLDVLAPCGLGDLLGLR